MSANAKPLAGLRVGISISESDDLEARGFTRSAMNRLTVRLNDALLAAGATVVFGHDWREDGIMDAICRSALWSFGFPEPDAQPPVRNLLPWPDETRVDSEIRLRLDKIIEIRSAGLPAGLAREAPKAAEDRDLRRYLRSRGLTHLRRRLTEECQARICLGGRESGYQGRYPGILEEALLAFGASQPVYLVGLLGGVAEHLGRSILDLSNPRGGKESSPPPSEEAGKSLEDLYREHGQGNPPSINPLDDTGFELGRAWEAARDLGRERLGDNRLDRDENRRLVESRSEEEVIILVLRGLRREQAARSRT